MLKKRIILTALLSLVVVVTTASGVRTQQSEMLREEFHQTYPLSPGGRVSLGNINGAVRVAAWDRNEVKVDAVKMAYRRDRLDEAKIVVRADPSSIHAETEYNTRTQTFNSGEGRINNPATVEYTLTVPRGARIDSIELINGDLNIEGLEGDVKASTINGRLTAHELTGEVRLSTINGRLEAVFGRLNEMKPISLSSVNGAVTLTIPSDSNAELKASTVHGAISNDFGLPVRRGEYVGRDLAGQLGQGGARIKLGNVNGQISIKHAPDGRPISSATNHLGQTAVAENDEDTDEDFDVEDTKVEAMRAAREAMREATRARAEARRAQLEAQRAVLEAQRAERQAALQAARAQADAARAQTQAQRTQAENARAVAEAQRVVRREAARTRIEAQRVAREIAREDSIATEVVSNLRLVERESKNFTVSGTPNVNLQTFDGYITVRGWDKPEIQVSISKRAATEQQMRGLHVKATQNGSNVHVSTSFDESFAGREGNVTYTQALVNLDVYVPRNAVLRVASGDGRLEVMGVNGSLDLATGDGRIDVRDVRGRLTARTGDGRIQVENFDGEIEAKTGDGRIYLDGRFRSLAANTGSGSIMLSVPADFNATIETDAEAVDNEGMTLTEESGASGRLKRWKIGQGGTVLTLKTGDGRILVRRAGP